MELQFSELDNNICLISLNGRLDITGTGQIETKFAGYGAGENTRVVVDLSGLDFLASIGIRLLILTAKSVASRGGKMGILNPVSEVQNVLEITGIPGIIRIYSDLESAEKGLTSSTS